MTGQTPPFFILIGRQDNDYFNTTDRFLIANNSVRHSSIKHKLFWRMRNITNSIKWLRFRA